MESHCCAIREARSTGGSAAAQPRQLHACQRCRGRRGCLTSRVLFLGLACCCAEMASANPTCPCVGAMVGLFQLSQCTWLRGSFAQLHAQNKDHNESPAKPCSGSPPPSASPSAPEDHGGSKLHPSMRPKQISLQVAKPKCSPVDTAAPPGKVAGPSAPVFHRDVVG